MAYVSEYEHDIFVSYAHDDDQPTNVSTVGWITTLVKNLEVELNRRVGPAKVSIWTDHRLAGNVPFDTQLMDAIRKTASLLVFMSPAYLRSAWCKQERESFLRFVSESREAGRVAVVQCDEVPQTEMPKEFGNLIGNKFWKKGDKVAVQFGYPVPNEEDKDYFQELKALSFDIAATFQRLKSMSAGLVGSVDKATMAQTATSNSRLPPSLAALPPKIFLAEVTDDIYQLREDVRSHLSQAGLAVVPAPGILYPRHDPGLFQTAMEQDLTDCKLFVQLLSAIPGAKPQALPQGYPGLQHELAVRAGIKILQWRSADLRVNEVADAAHRELLDGDHVIACGIAEFKQHIVAEANRKPAATTADKPQGRSVFVNHDKADGEIAAEVSRFFSSRGISAFRRLHAGEPDELRIDLEQKLTNCDALIVVYGAARPIWVRSQLDQAIKIVSQRQQAPAAQAICEGPPEVKDDLAVELPGFTSMNCRHGLDERVLGEFLERVQQ